MTPRLRLAFAALGLLVVVAVVGMMSGSRRADPSESQPATPLLDLHTFESVTLLPPEQRRAWVGDAAAAPSTAAEPRRAPPVVPAAGAPPNAAAASAVARAGSIPANANLPSGTRSYRVRENDNLQKIARAQYRSDKYWRFLAEANGISNPSQLKIGQTLLLPPVPATAPAAAQAAASAPPAGGGRTHVVKNGETLGAIAKKYYGTTQEWRRLLEANGLKKPEDLRVGQTLQIPAR